MARLLRMRVSRHAALAEVFASAYTAAALRGDLIACQYFRERRDQAAFLRDQLQEYLRRYEHGELDPVLHLSTWLGGGALVAVWVFAIAYFLTHH